ncbi:hypothetical protein MBH78_15270 [Oceanimonas sp. NS1]|nr:hypothetical protein [Oceanimonas sp. NS1]
MNKLFKLAGALALVLTATLAQAQGKIAVVDTGEVFQKMPQREVVRNQLKNEFASRVKEVQQLEEQGRSFVEKQQKTWPL